METHKVRALAAIAAALTILFSAFVSGPTLAQGGARAKIDAGELEGDVYDGLRVFKGIPYAAPPVGELRWRAPQPLAPWTGVRQAYEFGPACPQASSKDVKLDDMSEDCLTLNVWSPARRAGAGCR